MKIIIAIDSFKGSMTSLQAGNAAAQGVRRYLPDADIRLLLNRNQTGLISTLYQDPRILLQGLNQRTGRFRPFRESKAL